MKFLFNINDKKIQLRNANINDAESLWKWRNEKVTREFAFNSNFISFDSHLNWFKKKLNDFDSHIYIAFIDNNISVGQIRFDKVNENTFEVDISVDIKFRKKGFGTKLLKIGCTKIFQEFKIEKIISKIKLTNIASIKMFKKAGFKKKEIKLYDNSHTLEMILLNEKIS